MPVPEPQHVADHRHDGQGPGEVGPPVEPDLGGGGLEEQQLGQVVPGRLLQRVLKHLNLGLHGYNQCFGSVSF